MQMRRAWVVCDGFLGTPILVERCPTMAAALRRSAGGRRCTFRSRQDRHSTIGLANERRRQRMTYENPGIRACHPP